MKNTKLQEVARRVKVHNEKYGTEDYFLRAPKGYVVSEKLIAMYRATKPSISETARPGGAVTNRGKTALEKLTAAGISREELMKRVELAASRIKEIAGGSIPFFVTSNLMLVGIKEGKSVFVPYLVCY